MRQQEFVGGAIGACNPTRELLNEAATLFGKDRRVAQIISIGAGMPHILALESSRQSTETSQLLLIQSLLADCEVVAKELSTRLFAVDAYLRLNVDRGMEHTFITDWSSLGTIENHTSAYVEGAMITDALETSLGHLRSRVGSITLGQLSACILDSMCLPGIDGYYRPLEQHQGFCEGSPRGLALLRPEKSPVEFDGSSPCHVSKFTPTNIPNHRNGRVWEDTTGLVLLARASVIVSL